MEIYLHHYPASPFSEKVRALLGYLGLSWHSVVIPSIMPRPLLMPLSGGYRKTPVLQIGANVHCDSAMIARALARHTGDPTLFMPAFESQRVAEWADTQLFRIAVALNFGPEAVGSMLSQLGPGEAEAFVKDRAELTKGASMQRLSPAAARAYLDAYLNELEPSLGTPFLFGRTPCIADFSLYHCLWFLANNATNAKLLEPFGAVRAFMERIAAFGHGDAHEASGEDALAHAKRCEPERPDLPPSAPPGIAPGDRVSVTPVDYGLVPVEGTLAACGFDEIVLARETPETGAVMTHFPSPGFEIAKLSGEGR